LAVSGRKQKSCVTVAGLTDNINTIKGHDHPTYYGVKRDEPPYVKEHRDGEAFLQLTGCQRSRTLERSLLLSLQQKQVILLWLRTKTTVAKDDG
jgi:hypothetical protein